jgi:hypothetical protein
MIPFITPRTTGSQPVELLGYLMRSKLYFAWFSLVHMLTSLVTLILGLLAGSHMGILNTLSGGLFV